MAFDYAAARETAEEPKVKRSPKWMLSRAEVATGKTAATHFDGLVRKGIIGTPLDQSPQWVGEWRQNNIAMIQRNRDEWVLPIWC